MAGRNPKKGASMVGQDHNSVFQQWLAAYGSHLEQVAQGQSKDSGELTADRKDGSPGPNDLRES